MGAQWVLCAGSKQESRRAHLLNRYPAAERHWLLAHGPCATAYAHGRHDAPQTNAGISHPLVARDGPRRYLHSTHGLARAEEGRKIAPRSRTREVCRTRLAMETRIRRTNHRADATRRRISRLVAREVYDERRSVSRRARSVCATLRRRNDLSRQSHRELVPAGPNRAVGSRGR